MQRSNHTRVLCSNHRCGVWKHSLVATHKAVIIGWHHLKCGIILHIHVGLLLPTTHNAGVTSAGGGAGVTSTKARLLGQTAVQGVCKQHQQQHQHNRMDVVMVSYKKLWCGTARQHWGCRSCLACHAWVKSTSCVQIRSPGIELHVAWHFKAAACIAFHLPSQHSRPFSSAKESTKRVLASFLCRQTYASFMGYSSAQRSITKQWCSQITSNTDSQASIYCHSVRGCCFERECSNTTSINGLVASLMHCKRLSMTEQQASTQPAQQQHTGLHCSLVSSETLRTHVTDNERANIDQFDASWLGNSLMLRACATAAVKRTCTAELQTPSLLTKPLGSLNSYLHCLFALYAARQDRL